MKNNCDTVLVILNDRIAQLLGNKPIVDAFAEADDVLTTAAKSIAEIITVTGYVNVDFEDVKAVIKGAGAAVMGSAKAQGNNKAVEAVEGALNSPLLGYQNIQGAKKILLSIGYGQDAVLLMDELTLITNHIKTMIGNDAEMKFGYVQDLTLKESIRVTVIVAGFDNKQSEIVNLSGPSKSPTSIHHQPYLFDPISVCNTNNTNFTTDQQVNSHPSKKERKKMPNQKLDEASLGLDYYKQETFGQWEHRKMYGIELAAHSKGLKEFLEIPAYVRKGIKLSQLSFTKDDEVCYYQLEENHSI